MSLFQCKNCGSVENTALSNWWKKEWCSECTTGKWHGQFKKTILPKGMFFTNSKGNLEHKKNGDINLKKYAI